MDEDATTSTKEYLYLESQLKLFGKLCLNRNTSAINIITQPPLRYLTWQEVMPDRGPSTYLTGRLFDVSQVRNSPRAFVPSTATS